ncbi:tol-pal system protein YbgF [Sphaerotilus mobilis]|uniref:Cell division coordinator CpoB n=1 Tax=Sphaerotilus mobilis TaxID=47994 RepID=A0A4V2EWP2_9BURK|nr:tol-pal system protein YbgF [Sphaerotilus mobilis]RZS56680.1 tol-pal system protein YbgF [Sphaerotilus mobilis]
MNTTSRPMTLSRLAQALLTCLPLLGLVPTAQAGLFDDEEARKAILELRGRLDKAEAANTQLNQQLQQQQAARKVENTEMTEQLNVLRRGVLDLNSQIELLRGDMARLRGQDEQVSQSNRDATRELADLQRKQKDLLAALAAQDERLRRLEPQKVSLDGREITVDVAEKRAYDDAIGVLRKGDFARAVDALQAFQRRFAGSSYGGHVQYWLGNALYGKGDVKEAMATFRALVTTTPDHPRAAEALLAVANCQVELKDPKSARKTLDELVKNYPQSEAAQSGRERIAQLK